jgi:hypothetical protein
MAAVVRLPLDKSRLHRLGEMLKSLEREHAELSGQLQRARVTYVRLLEARDRQAGR